jgi:hypothetical protein
MPLLTTLRQSRQIWGGLLLGVLLALLPLRGWAEAAMHLSAPAPQSVASEVPVLPCHAAMVEHGGGVPDESASGCPLCSLCHGADLCPPESCIEQAAATTAAPAAMPQGHGPPALPLPERPPRA